LQRPVVTLAAVAALISLFCLSIPDFKLDASADSLVLENDEDLSYYRSIRARYGSDDFLIVTYTRRDDLFSEEALADLRRLRDSLRAIDRVASVTSILDVPLIKSPPISLSVVSDEVRTLETPDTDVALAKKELLSSALYQNLILSPDGKTTALQVVFKRDEIFYRLMRARDDLRETRLTRELSTAEKWELDRVSDEFQDYSSELVEQERRDIAAVREILGRHGNGAELFLGGVPMIAADMINFIRHDLLVFGVGVLCFLVLMLLFFFKRPRWVVLPLLCCGGSILFMFGYLGLVGWRVTVVSSNFTSLLLIITLSLTVHLIVRYHEIHAAHPDAEQHFLVLETMRSKALPSLYTALTTIVAFGSLLVSGIRPVIDFGWMMAIGITVAFLISYALFPALLMLLKPKLTLPRHDLTGAFTRFLAMLVERHSRLILSLFAIGALMSGLGIMRLTVENRFIDNFKKTTDIYRGMEMIDNKLGGTTPLDVILDADADFFTEGEEEWEEGSIWAELEEDYEEDAGLSGTSYWYTDYRLGMIRSLHSYLDGLPETGKVLSLATTVDMMQDLNEGKPLDNITLAIVHKKLPAIIKENLFDPYMSEDANQVRLAVRVFESDRSLRRNQLLETIHRHLTEKMGLPAEQFHLTGMLVLYNNMLQSLYRSQILTIGVVFLAIMVMFLVLFRSVKLAVIAITPNVISAGMVLGLMGWLDIPLDIMTITIAAITIGIAVDDTIHYIHRFLTEIKKDNDYVAAMKRSHASIGRAMYYTSITIIIGFSILALSSFTPTIYFGLLAGFAMAAALIANLTLLAALLIALKAK
jgi:predicted RND superfamily exporter protein